MSQTLRRAITSESPIYLAMDIPTNIHAGPPYKPTSPMTLTREEPYRCAMTMTVIQRMFAPFKKYLPSWIYNPIRSAGTAFLGPIRFGYTTGYFLSCFKMVAVSKDGDPFPWYTYPCIDFLRFRNFEDKTILEFGGGQSTLWWAKRAKNVVTLEGDKNWYEKITNNMPENVQLHHVSMESVNVNVKQVNDLLTLNKYSEFDVIVIDGLYRSEMIPIALRLMASDGIIICDDAEGYGFYEKAYPVVPGSHALSTSTGLVPS